MKDDSCKPGVWVLSHSCSQFMGVLGKPEAIGLKVWRAPLGWNSCSFWRKWVTTVKPLNWSMDTDAWNNNHGGKCQHEYMSQISEHDPENHRNGTGRALRVLGMAFDMLSCQTVYLWGHYLWTLKLRWNLRKGKPLSGETEAREEMMGARQWWHWRLLFQNDEWFGYFSVQVLFTSVICRQDNDCQSV